MTSHRSSKDLPASSGRVFFVSASQLADFFQCNAKYDFSRKMAPKKPLSPQIRDGIAVHELMADQKLSVRASKRAIDVLENLTRFVDRRYEISGREIKQEIELSNEIHLLRTVDAVATDSLGPVVIDYKITNRQWDVIPELNLAPRAAGFQAQCYLIPSGDNWPGRIHFVVADDEQIKVYEYERGRDDLANVLAAAENMKVAWDTGRLPKNRGYMCHSFCQWRRICYDEKDAIEDYELVENSPYHADLRYLEGETD